MKVALKIRQEYWTWKWNSSAELVTTDTLNNLFQIETSNIHSPFSQHLCQVGGGQINYEHCYNPRAHIEQYAPKIVSIYLNQNEKKLQNWSIIDY